MNSLNIDLLKRVRSCSTFFFLHENPSVAVEDISRMYISNTSIFDSIFKKYPSIF